MAVEALVFVRLRPKNDPSVRHFVEEVWKIEATTAVYLVTGGDDAIVHVTTTSTESMRATVLEHIGRSRRSLTSGPPSCSNIDPADRAKPITEELRAMTVLITGAGSGMGAARVERLRRADRPVVGVDLANADVVADLGTDVGREAVVDAVAGRQLHGACTFAGVSGFGGRPGSLVVSINYFGSIRVLESLRPQLAAAKGAAVAVSSNSATTAPGLDERLVNACLAGDEQGARDLADEIGGPGAYAASKLAGARWVRRTAPSADWAGNKISLNALSPGHIDTALTAEMMREEIARDIIARSPLPIGRPGQPHEVAALTEFSSARTVVSSSARSSTSTVGLTRFAALTIGRPHVSGARRRARVDRRPTAERDPSERVAMTRAVRDSTDNQQGATEGNI
ncbi:MAG: SDR family oxidoreductase [Rhodococcus fascians]